VRGLDGFGSKEIDLPEKYVIQQTPPNIRCGE
jgi:hypothetical protein